MTFSHLHDIRFHAHQPIRDAMEQFNKTAVFTEERGFGVVVDDDNRCVGVVTDGDLRRKLVEGASLDTPIHEVMNKNFVCSLPGDSSHQILRLFDRRVKTIPVLDEERRLVDIMRYSDFTLDKRVDKKIIRSRVPVRVSFAGGGTDMSYYCNHNTGFVLNATINKYCYATVRIRNDGKCRITSRDFNEEVEAADFRALTYDNSLNLIKACVRIMEPDFSFDLETYSEVEPGTGLGGSSAMATAVIGAFNHFRNDNSLDRYQIADLAYQAERIELGISGGWQDQYSTVFGGLNLTEFRQNEIVVFPLRISEDILLELHYNLLLFRFGKNRKSSAIVDDQHNSFLMSEDLESKYEQMGQLALKLKDALLKGRLKQFGQLLHEGWEIKKTLSGKISNGYIDQLYSTARQTGALGGKVLGAGSEGYLLIFCCPSYQVNVIDALSAIGARKETFDFVETGLQTWTAQQ